MDDIIVVDPSGRVVYTPASESLGTVDNVWANFIDPSRNTCTNAVHMAHLYALKNQEHDSREILERAWKKLTIIRKPPQEGDMELLRSLVGVLLHERKLDDCIRVLNTAAQRPHMKNSPEFSHLMGCYMWRSERYEEASRYFAVAIKVEPHNLDFLLNDGLLCVTTKRLGRAWNRFKTILEYYDPVPHEAYIGLALVHYRAKQYIKTAFYVDRAIKSFAVPHKATVLALRLFRVILMRVAVLAKAESKSKIECGGGGEDDGDEVDPRLRTADTFEVLMEEVPKVSHWHKNYLIVWLVCESCARTGGPSAFAFLQKLLSGLPRHSPSLAFMNYTLGRMYHAKGEYGKASQMYQASIAAHKFPCAVFRNACLSLILQPFAKKEVVQSIGDVQSIDAVKFLGALLMETDPPQAVKVLKDLTSMIGAKDSEAWCLYSLADRRDPRRALSHIEKCDQLQTINPLPLTHAMIATNKAALLLDKGDLNEAKKLLDSDVSQGMWGEADIATLPVTNVNYIALSNLALWFLKSDEYGKAEIIYNNLVAFDGACLPVLIGAAICALRLGRIERHKMLLHCCLALDPTCVDALLMLAEIEQKSSVIKSALGPLGSTEKSIVYAALGDNDLERAIVKSDKDPEYRKRYTFRALQYYEESLKTEPTNVVAQHNAACALSMLDMVPEAVVLLESLQAMHPAEQVDRTTLINLASLHIQQKNWASAIKCFETVLHDTVISTQDDVASYVHACHSLGGAFLHLNKFDDAIIALQKGLRLSPCDMSLHLSIAEVRLASVVRALAERSIPLDSKADEICLEYRKSLGLVEASLTSIAQHASCPREIQRTIQTLMELIPRCRAALTEVATQAYVALQKATTAQKMFRAKVTRDSKRYDDAQSQRQAEIDRIQAQLKERASLQHSTLVEAMRNVATQSSGGGGGGGGSSSRQKGAPNRIERDAQLLHEELGGEIEEEGQVDFDNDYDGLVGYATTKEVRDETQHQSEPRDDDAAAQDGMDIEDPSVEKEPAPLADTQLLDDGEERTQVPEGNEDDNGEPHAKRVRI
eukprot:PhF_6_TR11755/c0_g1_i1/m.19247/K15176/CTR9; RNA polymerase-associated protein CTR9